MYIPPFFQTHLYGAVPRWESLQRSPRISGENQLHLNSVYQYVSINIFRNIPACCDYFLQLFSNQIFHYTRCNTPKRVTSLRSPSPRHCSRATQLLSKKMSQRWQTVGSTVSDLTGPRFEPQTLAPWTKALPLDQLAASAFFIALNCTRKVTISGA